jgi:hypothetical protein
MKLKLIHPISVGQKTIEELTFREHTLASDYLAFDTRGGVAQNIALIASLSGTDEALIRRLSGADYRAAAKIAGDLIDGDEALPGAETAEKKPFES